MALGVCGRQPPSAWEQDCRGVWWALMQFEMLTAELPSCLSAVCFTPAAHWCVVTVLQACHVSVEHRS